MPIALAINAAMPDGWFCQVVPQQAKEGWVSVFRKTHNRLLYEGQVTLPESANAFANAFDGGSLPKTQLKKLFPKKFTLS